jgi:isopenicillin-N N-acyltransferase like protein
MSRFQLYLITVLLFFPVGPACSCTLWSSAGPVNKGGDFTLVAKNRDWTPDQTQVLKIVRPDHGYAYLGLIATGAAEPGLKAGINRKGLVIVSASVDSIPKKVRKQAPGKMGVIRRLLSNYGSVVEILNHRKIFSQARPMILMIADRRTILYAEIGLNGHYCLVTQVNGTLAHTNHFLSPDMLAQNRKIGQSSRIRLKRIQDLLMSRPAGGFTMDDFIRMSEDQHDGPRNSILRKGALPGDEKTVATWIAAIPREGAPTVQITVRNPDQKVETFRYRLDDAFWLPSGRIDAIAPNP